MKLVEAVAKAPTPEDLTSVLEEVARRYLVARGEEKKFSEAKAEIREACLAALRRLETESHEWEADGRQFRAQVFYSTKVIPSNDLIRKLAALGLTDCYEVQYKLNEVEIEKAIKRGLIGVEEVRTLSQVRKVEVFRIDEIKPREVGLLVDED